MEKSGKMSQGSSTKVIHSGRATSFADPADIKAFRKCKAEGHSDEFCFSKGDNGRGCWGDDTTGEYNETPMCALPPEDWKEFGKAARGKKVLVQAGGRTIICELRDTMPHRANIKNGAIIDLNPAACKALGIRIPASTMCLWSWL